MGSFPHSPFTRWAPRPAAGGGGVPPGSWVTDGVAYLIDNGATLDLNGDYTICGWFKAHADNIDGSQHCYFFLQATDTNFERLTNQNDMCIVFSLPAGAFPVFDVAGMDDAVWQHLAMQREGTTMRAFLNGALIDSGAADDAGRTGIDLIRIGTSDGQSWRGKIAHIRAWQSVLTAGQLATESASATAVITSALSFDLGSVEADGVGYDNSGNGRHFTQTAGTYTFDSDTPL